MAARENGATHRCWECDRPLKRAGYCVGCETELDRAQDDYFWALNQDE